LITFTTTYFVYMMICFFEKKIFGISKKRVYLQKILVPDTAYRIKVIGDDTFDSAY